jgi:prepilin-type N-terminal cleavage/methylation domain-containing protein
MQLKRSQRGFSLVELAVVFAIVALLIGGAMMTLSAQVEQRSTSETQHRLNAAVDAVLAFAIVNGRLPCPAVGGATGDEAFTGSNCTTWYGGFLPAKTIGFQPTDSAGYAVDSWGNRIRYAVAQTVTGCTGTVTNPHFVSQANLKANGISCKPRDLDICNTATGITGSGSSASCASPTARAVTSNTVAFIVFSTGKDGAIAGSYGPDELANVNNDAAFVSRTPSGPDSAAGTYDDLMVWVPAGVVYAKLIAAGVLP